MLTCLLLDWGRSISIIIQSVQLSRSSIMLHTCVQVHGAAHEMQMRHCNGAASKGTEVTKDEMPTERPSSPDHASSIRGLTVKASNGHRMHNNSYEALPGAPSPEPSSRGFFFPNRRYSSGGFNQPLFGDSDEEDNLPPGVAADSTLPVGQTPWWKRWWRHSSSTGAAAESQVLTLIPLSDSRLQPQRTKLLLTILFLLAVTSVGTVFLLVPRGVTVGTIQVHSSQIAFNTTQSTYQIILAATIPVYNPNYLSVLLSGHINVSFYDQQAGYKKVHPYIVPAGAQPEVIEVEMDASSVPQKYLFTIYTQCFTFPEKLIFFLTGSLQVVYLGKAIHLPLIDNYFIIPCNQSHAAREEAKSILGHCKALPSSPLLLPP